MVINLCPLVQCTCLTIKRYSGGGFGDSEQSRPSLVMWTSKQLERYAIMLAEHTVLWSNMFLCYLYYIMLNVIHQGYSTDKNVQARVRGYHAIWQPQSFESTLLIVGLNNTAAQPMAKSVLQVIKVAMWMW